MFFFYLLFFRIAAEGDHIAVFFQIFNGAFPAVMAVETVGLGAAEFGAF